VGRHQYGAIQSVLSQNVPTPEDRSGPPQNPPVRGRGATRANGTVDPVANSTTPMPPPSHTSSVPTARNEGHHGRSSRSDAPPNLVEGAPAEEVRTHRESRRSGRERSRSPNSERERPSRTGPPRAEGDERERREKRGGERDGSSRRDREREPRESSRRERGSRDEGRRGDERRSRGGGSGNGSQDERKRGRDPQDQGQHGDVKRRR
jgi:THO complex subunit 2